MAYPLSEQDIALVRSLVIHEDAHVIAFNKPPGLSSQGGRIQAATLDDMMAAFASKGGNRPRLVHRLDRDTSGVILAGKTQPAASFLGKAMQARRIHKTYLAIVTPGAPHPRQGAIDAPLRREEIGREAYMRVCDGVEEGALTARTLYRTLADSALAALVEARPQTGRMHQLRVHLAHIGRPIAGDVRYGGALTVGGEPAPRLMLHAQVLEFPHPEGGRTRIAAPVPADFAALCEAAELRFGNAQAPDTID